ncbi:MAG TPA: hypothetical protein VF160_12945 [Candidatus Dormibacteraeota bacterium]
MGIISDRSLISYAGALGERTRYLVRTGRLSNASTQEMNLLSEELRALDELFVAAMDKAGGSSQLIGSRLLDAFSREVRRHGSLVLPDARRTRERARQLRVRAEATRRDSVRGRLRVVPTPTGLIDLGSLERLARRLGKAG